MKRMKSFYENKTSQYQVIKSYRDEVAGELKGLFFTGWEHPRNKNSVMLDIEDGGEPVQIDKISVKEIGMNEAVRRLVKVRGIWDGGGAWVMNYSGGQKIFRGTIEEFSKFLQKIRASDSQTTPKSKRNVRYIDIAREIQTGKDRTFWVWSNVLDTLSGLIIKSK